MNAIHYEIYCNAMDGRNLEKIYTTKSKADALQYCKAAENKYKGVLCDEIEILTLKYADPIVTVLNRIYKSEA